MYTLTEGKKNLQLTMAELRTITLVLFITISCFLTVAIFLAIILHSTHNILTNILTDMKVHYFFFLLLLFLFIYYTFSNNILTCQFALEVLRYRPPRAEITAARYDAHLLPDSLVFNKKKNNKKK